jgi:ankyrin repeat protein
MEPIITEAEEKRYVQLQLNALEAARTGDDVVLSFMLDAGMPVNLHDAKGNTMLMLASYHGHVSTVECLLKAGADPDRRNARGQTPLGGVAFKGYVEVATLLLDAGADLNADQGGGATPLMFGSLFGRTEMVALLRQRGANAGPRASLGWVAGVVGRLVGIVSRLRNLFRSAHPLAHVRVR